MEHNGGPEKYAFDGELISIGDTVVFTSTGIMGKGKVLALDLPGVSGCVLIGSLVVKTRTLLATAENCAVVSKGAQS